MLYTRVILVDLIAHRFNDCNSILQEKLYQWISKQEAEGLRVTSEDILAYIEVTIILLFILLLFHVHSV